MDDPHHWITRLRSLTFHGYELDAWLGKLSLALPWSQLQTLVVENICVTDLRPLIELLHQTSKLQVLRLIIRKRHIDTLQESTTVLHLTQVGTVRVK